MNKVCNTQGSMLISLLIVVLILGGLFFFMTQGNRKAQDAANSNQKYIQDAGINASSYKKMIDSTRETLDKAQADRAQSW